MFISEIVASPWQWALLFACALLIGMSKTGMQGISTISIPLLAIAFGAKPSTGLILPMLCLADVVAVIYYRRSAQWKHILRLLPTAIAGFFIALAVDRALPQAWFKYLMAASIFAGMAVMFYTGRQGAKTDLTGKWWYTASFGLLGGFATMIGNAAGPIMSVYLLSVRLPKYAFVGTAAWFFLVVNYLKLPLQAFVWKNITVSSLAAGAMCVPFILLGALVGIRLVRRMPERGYKAFIIATTLLSTAAMLF